MRDGVLTTPRSVPGRMVPAAGALLVLGLALVIFLVAGWNLAGWALGAVLWVGLEAAGLLIAHTRKQTSGVASSGVLAFGLVFKTTAALAVLVAGRGQQSGPRPRCDPGLRPRLHL